MSSVGTLYSPAASPRCPILNYIIDFYNLPVKIAEKDDLFVKHFPLGKVPAFLGAGEKFKLHETLAILLYVVSLISRPGNLLGSTKNEYFEVLKWLSFINSDITTEYVNAVFPVIGAYPYNEQRVLDGRKQLNKYAKVFEDYLGEQEFLVGTDVTLADYFAAVFFKQCFETCWDKYWAKSHPNITKWFTVVLEKPLLKKNIPDFKIIKEKLKPKL
ncbi:translation elongation factor EF-1 gamma [Ascoidea rubescens DSM 1968]|uniref:Translation elongation factor EF-1 gamma n=1 Tax=Ascoidea rubescens DSM 1968 TaxID=1344418 RepID=A0A1D2VAJ8_9ASCO|nr:translation elongation factor EF-1 gamma [Ascoidea rubescens DSM 1968]ODV58716.1 translation elongation factor EF-1 gamma [Ascoidea rubescens DSM 1968]